ncbi:hypothetical protein [Burkholderia cepacia]|uniref:hypothetical protein n=1 Tax=Burkholderia cepacia TaxID=292 RepID=UPI00201A0332|nr:hypothetical protein [Burkholderia cepacia]UQO36354.1 hypothetical protein L0Z22_27200 [Burkholderia cepacia]UQO50681.1 hypothetical protein L0Z05_33330 [Burkholderia cepacia]UQP04841.1 hypothetical protein L0Z01_10140 [Burkholderia cepacia]
MKFVRWIEARLPHDKALHVIAGVVVFGTAHFGGWLIGMAAVVIVAVAKELLDRRTGGVPSAWDAAATVAGGLLGLLCSIA